MDNNYAVANFIPHPDPDVYPLSEAPNRPFTRSSAASCHWNGAAAWTERYSVRHPSRRVEDCSEARSWKRESYRKVAKNYSLSRETIRRL